MASFVINKQQFFVSFYLLLRCLRDTTDKHIFDAIIRGSSGSGGTTPGGASKPEPNAAVAAMRAKYQAREAAHTAAMAATIRPTTRLPVRVSGRR